MKPNEGPIDRIIRAIVAAAIAAGSYYFLSGALEIIGYVVAVILLVTAATGFCGIYKLLGINTCKIKAPQSPTNSQPEQSASPQPESQKPTDQNLNQ